MAFLTWPVVCLIFGLVALLVFKKSLEAAIGRIPHAGKDGVTLQPAQNNLLAAGSPTRTADELLRDLGDSAPLLEIEQNLAPRLEGMSDAEKARALSRLSANLLSK